MRNLPPPHLVVSLSHPFVAPAYNFDGNEEHTNGYEKRESLLSPTYNISRTCTHKQTHAHTVNTWKIDRSIHRWVYIRPSLTRLCLDLEPRGAREPLARVRRTIEGRREPPEGSLVAQLSHLPIGPSHVLICLLVNPSFLSYRLFRSLSLSLFLLTFVKPQNASLPLLLFLFCLLPFFSRRSALSFFPHLLTFFPPRSWAKLRRRSLQNEFDRETSETIEINARYIENCQLSLTKRG